MTKETFTKLIKTHDIIISNAYSLYQVGVDLFESKYKMVPLVNELFDAVMKEQYDEEGIEWIDWFINHNKSGRRGLEARAADGTLICQTIEELYEYLESNHKLR